MPMQKNSTLSQRIVADSDLSECKKEQNPLQPSKKTIQNILQFAAAYRPERIAENRLTEIYLN